jgi:hypothetical protein
MDGHGWEASLRGDGSPPASHLTLGGTQLSKLPVLRAHPNLELVEVEAARRVVREP